MAIPSDHYRFEAVSPRAWAATAVDSGAGVGNAAFADLGDGRAIVVDCGFTPSAARDLRAAAETLVGPVDRLVVTHAHLDHYGGAQVFADVPIISTTQTRAGIETGGPERIADLRAGADSYLAELAERGAPEWERDQGRRIMAELPLLELTPPTEIFAGELELGRARVLECGSGHSQSDSVVWLPGERVLFASDLVSVATHSNLARGDPQNWLATLDRLAALGPERVVPGHGPPARAEAITSTRRYIETVLALAAQPGEAELPALYASWAFAEGFDRNIEALRSRA